MWSGFLFYKTFVGLISNSSIYETNFGEKFKGLWNISLGWIIYEII